MTECTTGTLVVNKIGGFNIFLNDKVNNRTKVFNSILVVFIAFALFFIPNKYKAMVDSKEEIVTEHKKIEKENQKKIEDLTNNLDKVNEDIKDKEKDFEVSLNKKDEALKEKNKVLNEKDKKIAQLEKKVKKQTPTRSQISRRVSEKSLSTFSSTAYCSCRKCCGPNAKGITATGTKVKAGRTIAVDPNVIPLGSKVLIDGKQYIAEDTGSAVKGKIVDIYFDNHDTALAWGRKNVKVQVVK